MVSISEQQFAEFCEAFDRVLHDSSFALTVMRVGADGTVAHGVWLRKGEINPARDHFFAGGEHHKLEQLVNQSEMLPRRDYVLVRHNPDAADRERIARNMAHWLQKHLQTPAAVSLCNSINAALQAQ